MKKQGKSLNFISRINRDGSGVVFVDESDVSYCHNEVFYLNRLSISKDTYIACGFNSYVVTLKTNP